MSLKLIYVTFMYDVNKLNYLIFLKAFCCPRNKNNIPFKK